MSGRCLVVREVVLLRHPWVVDLQLFYPRLALQRLAAHHPRDEHHAAYRGLPAAARAQTPS